MPETLEFNSDLDIHDNLIQLHPRLRDETYYNEVKYIVSEAPLKESFPNPQEFYVAKRLLFWGTHAALTDGYFDRASQFQNIDQSFFFYNESEDGDDLFWSIQKQILHDCKEQEFITPITADFMTKWIDRYMAARQENPTLDPYDAMAVCINQFRHFNGRALTSDEVTTIKEDVLKIAHFNNRLIFEYLPQRGEKTNQLITLATEGVTAETKKTIHGFINGGYSHRMGVMMNEMVTQKERVLSNLSNWWQTQFVYFYESQNLPVPNFKFKHPLDGDTQKGETDYFPLPYDLIYKDSSKFNFGGPGYSELLVGYSHELLPEWANKNHSMQPEQILNWLEKTKKEVIREANSNFGINNTELLTSQVNKINIFHLWITALADADMDNRMKRARRQSQNASFLDAPQPYHLAVDREDETTVYLIPKKDSSETHDDYGQREVIHSQFAARIYQIMMQPAIHDALPQEIQQLIPFFAQKDDSLESMLKDVKLDLE